MKRKYFFDQANFSKLPGQPIAYWLSFDLLNVFSKGQALSSFGKPRQGLATGNNDLFLREWYECDFTKIGFGCSSVEDFQKKGYFYAPYNKGGGYKKWYGNFDLVIRFDKENYDILSKQGNHLPSRQLYFKEGLTWSALGNVFGMRYSKEGSVFDTKGATFFANDQKSIIYILSLMNSEVVNKLLSIVSPTLDFNPGPISTIPVIYSKSELETINKLGWRNIEISKDDYDSFEESVDFKKHELIGEKNNMGRLLKNIYSKWEKDCLDRYSNLKSNEEAINQIFINLYGLQNELTPTVKDSDVSIKLADKTRDIKSLLSYFIGLLFGRYSLNQEGLIFAGGEFDYSKCDDYVSKDEVLPIYNFVGIEDGLTNRVCKLVKLIYGEETFTENISFIASSLGKKDSESPVDAINRYFNEDFYNDHVKIYQKRPIYWMLSSGEKGAFKCLIYVHRYTKNTLALINSKYFLPRTAMYKQERIKTETKLKSTALDQKERKRNENYLQNILDCENELLSYGQVLNHVANQFIDINLDDGVKNNYLKFQDIPMQIDGVVTNKNLFLPLGYEKKGGKGK
ncbi:MAG: BREX-1 system adenine-specific DNA-methyltransferase PglX [Bacilli bacterium]|nr:BREX-1 system adenine-specific DNA-methyltransferase PglX [Bacilli bacterium]